MTAVKGMCGVRQETPDDCQLTHWFNGFTAGFGAEAGLNGSGIKRVTVYGQDVQCNTHTHTHTLIRWQQQQQQKGITGVDGR